MRVVFQILLLATGFTACTKGREAFNDLHAGMSRSQVEQVLGTPDSSRLRNGEQCDLYSLWRDFWNRRPGNYSDRYFVCYDDNKIISYGMVGDEF